MCTQLFLMIHGAYLKNCKSTSYEITTFTKPISTCVNSKVKKHKFLLLVLLIKVNAAAQYRLIINGCPFLAIDLLPFIILIAGNFSRPPLKIGVHNTRNKTISKGHSRSRYYVCVFSSCVRGTNLKMIMMLLLIEKANAKPTVFIYPQNSAQ